MKDFVVGFLPRQDKWWAKKHSPWCQNFMLRFVYEFFLEFCICVILQLSVKDLTMFSPSFQYFSSIAMFLGILSLVGFVLSLFYFGGPWISGFYIPKTAAKSALFDHRSRNPHFDGKQWLKENPKPKIKPWGGFVITLDFTSMGKFFSCKGTKPALKAKVNFKHLNDAPEEPGDKAKKEAAADNEAGKQDAAENDAVPETERGLISSLLGSPKKENADNVDSDKDSSEHNNQSNQNTML